MESKKKQKGSAWHKMGLNGSSMDISENIGTEPVTEELTETFPVPEKRKRGRPPKKKPAQAEEELPRTADRDPPSSSSVAVSDEFVLNSILDDLMFEQAVDMIWTVRSGQITLDELYGVQPLAKYRSVRPRTATNSSNINVNSITVKCNVCGEMVAATRYAPHLERCINGGKRGTRKHYDYLHDNSAYYKPKPKKDPPIDPLPNSPIIKLKVKNGYPIGTLFRIGVSSEEFSTVRSQSLNGNTSGGGHKVV